MPKYFADAASWANVIPPSALIASIPSAPSEAVPDSTTPIARFFWEAASERNRKSIGWWRAIGSSRGDSRSTPLRTSMFTFGGMTYTLLGWIRIRSVTSATGSGVARARISVSRLSCLGSRCCTTRKAIPPPAGKDLSRRSSASRPPAEAPIPTIGSWRASGRLDCLPRGLALRRVLGGGRTSLRLGIGLYEGREDCTHLESEGRRGLTIGWSQRTAEGTIVAAVTGRKNIQYVWK